MGRALTSGTTALAPSGCLRILQTTDLHMHVSDYDYFSDRIDHGIGLIRLSHLITALRSETAVTTLLCDNGDTLQGNPLADHLARNCNSHAPHPMIMALNLLGYDAMTLGNHDFDYGVSFLRHALKDARFPVVSANVEVTPAPRLALEFVVLDRQILCDDGHSRPIRIGITGFAPPCALEWKDAAQDSKIDASDIIGAARRIVPAIKAAGADIVIALCHGGIGGAAHVANMQNAAVPLAAVAGIDVLLAGHTHEVFPDPDKPANDAVDPVAGSLHGKPTVMAGAHGRALGVVDLALAWVDESWRLNGHKVRLHTPPDPAPPSGPLQLELEQLVAKSHIETLAFTQKAIARTAFPINSYFATVQPDLSQQLLGRAAQQAIRTALRDSDHAGVPILSADAPYRFGGQGGLSHYIDIPAGEITQGDAAAIFPFADVLCGVRRTGAQIADWLERSAAHYNRIEQGKHDQALINPQSAGYNCDALLGLHYEIDLGAAPRFNANGDVIDPEAKRIKHMTYQGKPVASDDIFVVAVNSFRVRGGGGFAMIDPADILHVSSGRTSDILVDYLKSVGDVTEPAVQTWCFTPLADTSAIFQSAPLAKAHLAGNIMRIGPGRGGFDTYRITF